MSGVHKTAWWVRIIIIIFLFGSSFSIGGWRPKSASATNTSLPPIVDEIYPPAVHTRSPDTVAVLRGHNFGNVNDVIDIRLRNEVVDQLLEPIVVIDEVLAFSIPGSYLVSATTYTITVEVCIFDRVPIIPCEEYEESNPVRLDVVDFIHFYLPVMHK